MVDASPNRPARARRRIEARRARPLVDGLTLQHEAIMPVSLPAIFGGFTADRLFFAVADGFELGRADAARTQRLQRGSGAPFSQPQLGRARPTSVASAPHSDLP